nr:uncharacterized protein LOC123290052 isoform X2 [Equus asinus]
MTSRGVMQVTRRARASSKMRKQHTQGRAQMGKLLQTNHTPPQGCWPAGTREATEADLHLTSTFQMLCCELPDGDGPTWQGTDVSGSQAGRTRGCQQSLETADILYVYNGYLIRVFNRKEMNQLQKNHLSYLKVFIKVPHTAICRSTEDAKKKALSFAFKAHVTQNSERKGKGGKSYSPQEETEEIPRVRKSYFTACWCQECQEKTS